MFRNLKIPDKDAVPVCDGRAWRGIAEAYGTTFVVELFPSTKHSGYYHYVEHCLTDDFLNETQKPVRADGVKAHMTLSLALHNLQLDEFHWQEVSTNDLKLPHHERSGNDNPNAE